MFVILETSRGPMAIDKDRVLCITEDTPRKGTPRTAVHMDGNATTVVWGLSVEEVAFRLNRPTYETGVSCTVEISEADAEKIINKYARQITDSATLM